MFVSLKFNFVSTGGILADGADEQQHSDDHDAVSCGQGATLFL
jgi:hypothetical protein